MKEMRCRVKETRRPRERQALSALVFPRPN